jgi:hypothetical protein
VQEQQSSIRIEELERTLREQFAASEAQLRDAHESQVRALEHARTQEKNALVDEHEKALLALSERLLGEKKALQEAQAAAIEDVQVSSDKHVAAQAAIAEAKQQEMQARIDALFLQYDHERKERQRVIARVEEQEAELARRAEAFDKLVQQLDGAREALSATVERMGEIAKRGV